MENMDTASVAVEEATPHNLVMQRARDMLITILDDPFLTGLSDGCDVETVQSQLALMQGKAITIHINKFDGGVICE